ncbi:TRAP transporter small permease [Anaerotruncus colihominis]|uniref:TRAP transporter small permease n=1 Tax=Anaerotruncus colihominis TaxID=169435 RepID=UPI0026EC43D7|nr:TRAP transporter small permease [Anaerotruncus colihominis]
MKKVSQAIDGIERILLVYPFLLLGCCIVFEVFSRKFFGFGLSWLQELGKYIMVYGTFLGAAIAVKDRSHPAMSAIKDSLPRLPRIMVSVLTNLLCAGCIGVVSYYSWIKLANYIRIGTKTSSLWGLPMWVPFLAMPVCLSVMALRFLLQCCLEPAEIMKSMGQKGEGELS